MGLPVATPLSSTSTARPVTVRSDMARMTSSTMARSLRLFLMMDASK